MAARDRELEVGRKPHRSRAGCAIATERHAGDQALSFLREGAPQLVMFAAVVDVPPDRVAPAALGQRDDADPGACAAGQGLSRSLQAFGENGLVQSIGQDGMPNPG